MIKDAMSHNETVKPNDRQMKVLRENFPGCFKSDGSFDLERFKEFLGTEVNITNEGYELKFLGKNYARLLASLDTTTVVVPDEEHNSKPENKDSQNVYISGDNLDALKHLLKSYAGKVKCIYIDPPYNTGSDGFVYNDKFEFSAEQLATKLSIEENQAQRILDFTSRGSASHSAWLMFMYPRLLLARDLLADDGVIFISIDDNEYANLKLLCDDIYGFENFAGVILWKKKTNGNPVGVIPPVHDYILVYTKEADKVGEIGYEPTKEYYSKNYSNPDNDPRGPWTTMDLSANHKGPYFKISNPLTGEEYYPPEGRYWVFNEAEVLRRINEGRIIFGKSGTARPCQKVFASEKATKKLCAESWWDSHGMNENATEELKSVLGQAKLFSHPKPTKLLKNIIQIATDSHPTEPQIVIDFFSGSATTADSIMQINAESGTNHQYIVVQLPENLDMRLGKREASSESSIKAQISFLDTCHRPHTLDQIGIERIIRASRKIKEAYPDTTVDLGFKHYTLQEPNETTIDKLERFVCKTEMFVDNNILADFGCETVLATWLVDDGYGLTSPAREIDFAGYKAYYIDKHLYLIHEIKSVYDTDSKIDEKEVITAIVDKIDMDASFNPENVILFGYNFPYTVIEAFKTNLNRLQHSEKNKHINFVVRY